MNKNELKSKLSKSVDFLKAELTQIRTGRASPSLLEDIEVEAYDSIMTVKELGSITLLDPQNIIVAPWDKSLLQAIGKAIRESELNLSPVEESDRIRVPLPALTEDRRVELTKLVSVKVEDAKNSLRSIRQDAMKDIEKDFIAKVISEDEKFSLKDDVEELVKEAVSSAEDIGETKKQDLMTV